MSIQREDQTQPLTLQRLEAALPVLTQTCQFNEKTSHSHSLSNDWRQLYLFSHRLVNSTRRPEHSHSLSNDWRQLYLFSHRLVNSTRRPDTATHSPTTGGSSTCSHTDLLIQREDQSQPLTLQRLEAALRILTQTCQFNEKTRHSHSLSNDWRQLYLFSHRLVNSTRRPEHSHSLSNDWRQLYVFSHRLVNSTRRPDTATHSPTTGGSSTCSHTDLSIQREDQNTATHSPTTGGSSTYSHTDLSIQREDQTQPLTLQRLEAALPVLTQTCQFNEKTRTQPLTLQRLEAALRILTQTCQFNEKTRHSHSLSNDWRQLYLFSHRLVNSTRRPEHSHSLSNDWRQLYVFSHRLVNSTRRPDTATHSPTTGGSSTCSHTDLSIQREDQNTATHSPTTGGSSTCSHTDLLIQREDQNTATHSPTTGGSSTCSHTDLSIQREDQNTATHSPTTGGSSTCSHTDLLIQREDQNTATHSPTTGGSSTCSHTDLLIQREDQSQPLTLQRLEAALRILTQTCQFNEKTRHSHSLSNDWRQLYLFSHRLVNSTRRPVTATHSPTTGGSSTCSHTDLTIQREDQNTATHSPTTGGSSTCSHTDLLIQREDQSQPLTLQRLEAALRILTQTCQFNEKTRHSHSLSNDWRQLYLFSHRLVNSTRRPDTATHSPTTGGSSTCSHTDLSIQTCSHTDLSIQREDQTQSLTLQRLEAALPVLTQTCQFNEKTRHSHSLSNDWRQLYLFSHRLVNSTRRPDTATHSPTTGGSSTCSHTDLSIQREDQTQPLTLQRLEAALPVLTQTCQFNEKTRHSHSLSNDWRQLYVFSHRLVNSTRRPDTATHSPTTGGSSTCSHTYLSIQREDQSQPLTLQRLEAALPVLTQTCQFNEKTRHSHSLSNDWRQLYLFSYRLVNSTRIPDTATHSPTTGGSSACSHTDLSIQREDQTQPLTLQRLEAALRVLTQTCQFNEKTRTQPLTLQRLEASLPVLTQTCQFNEKTRHSHSLSNDWRQLYLFSHRLVNSTRRPDTATHSPTTGGSSTCSHTDLSIQ